MTMKNKKRKIKDSFTNISLSRMTYISHTLSGIAWLLIAASAFIINDTMSIIRTILIILAIVCTAFQITAILPKDKEDEMADLNLKKAESATLSGIKTYIVAALLVLFIALIITWRRGIRNVNIAFVFMVGVAILLSILGISNLLVGFFFRKYEKE